MKIIDFVEYLLMKQSNGEKVKFNDEFYKKASKFVCTATLEEAKQIVDYFVDDILRLVEAGRNKKSYNVNFNFKFKNGNNIVKCINLGSSDNSLCLPPYIDVESYNNICLAMDKTNIFDYAYSEYNAGEEYQKFKISKENINMYRKEKKKSI